MPPRSYVLTRAWDAEQLDAAEARLRSLGLLDGDGDGVTAAGREARARIERHTDRHCLVIVDELGPDLVELIGILQPWGDAIRAAHGYYPSSPQLATLDPAVDEWMRANGLPALSA